MRLAAFLKAVRLASTLNGVLLLLRAVRVLEIEVCRRLA
jgi:hypothetical protein